MKKKHSINSLSVSITMTDWYFTCRHKFLLLIPSFFKDFQFFLVLSKSLFNLLINSSSDNVLSAASLSFIIIFISRISSQFLCEVFLGKNGCEHFKANRETKCQCFLSGQTEVLEYPHDLRSFASQEQILFRNSLENQAEGQR